MDDYKSVESKMNEALDNIRKIYPNASVLVTGHSMGAALSIIVGVEIKLRLNVKV
jgi:putative lipase involved disintegration of autophagic bodies